LRDKKKKGEKESPTGETPLKIPTANKPHPVEIMNADSFKEDFDSYGNDI